MEKEIKAIPQELEDDKKKRDDKDTSKYLMIIFIPLIVIIILCFKYYKLRITGLCLSTFFMGYVSYKSYRARENKFDKEIRSQIILILLTILGFFFKFFGDLVLSYWTIALVCMLLMVILKVNNEKQKIYITYYVLFGAIITAIILNYRDILRFLKS